MSRAKARAGIAIPQFIMDYIDNLAEELDCFRSQVISDCVLYVSQHEDDFLSQFDLVEEEEEEEE